jgi:hypothetical protein
MREIRQLFTDVDSLFEDAARAKQELDAKRWRAEVRPHIMRRFAARATTLTWSRALLKEIVEELYPDDLFTQLVGNLDRVPQRQWPRVLAIAVALRHSWRRDALTRIARRLRISLTTTPGHERSRQSRPSRIRLFGSPRSCQGFPLRSNPIRGSRP